MSSSAKSEDLAYFCDVTHICGVPQLRSGWHSHASDAAPRVGIKSVPLAGNERFLQMGIATSSQLQAGLFSYSYHSTITVVSLRFTASTKP
jgi:hypothetical protein